jgi:hypothetical protein
MTTAAAPSACPQCGGDLWDNRADNAKKNDGRRRPDFRCKENKDHVIWPPREAKGSSANGVAAAPPAVPLTPEERGARLGRLMQMHSAITKHVVGQESPMFDTGKVGDSPEAASTRINTIFIAATQAGLHL